ncbi:motility associated factor glycosyltransferase family protein [Treponema vincentii]|uniref:motility associated factor glycosyltransferase family protein n=1 Tax=Treponema TaxID=157 RepID=UPI001BB04BEB|nr:6-hydroxymethylpterin diphosphokinase MptE-like protein [Treponema vincentii]QUY18529.1 motility associated factor glycosyltransferase family protein [Treponema vincentii]
MTILEKNLAAINIKQPELAEHLRRAQIGAAYKGTAPAKTGEPVPLFASGQALQSLYNPVREAERTAAAFSVGFMLFCGLGNGIHIKLFLDKSSQSFCAITESDYESFKQLLSLIDYTELLADSRVFLLPPCTDAAFETALVAAYLPALHGTFSYHILRTWSEQYTAQTKGLPEKIEHALEKIKADFSVQVHFGKIWLRNIFLNLRLAGFVKPAYPYTDTKRTALILGAGPSLEEGLVLLKQHRKRYTVFCTDTAFPAVCANGITPEFFIAIDPQHISYQHTIGVIPKETIGIFDLSANTAGARRFYENGNALFFTAGGHPLVQTAALFSPIPPLTTGSGTVAVAAYHAAQALGYRHIECIGMDFAYTGGTAYSRGTYLSAQYADAAMRVISQEHSFVRLMFRTETYSERTSKGITYRTPLLDSYRAAFEAEKHSIIRWQRADFQQFPYTAFLASFTENLKQNSLNTVMPLLPALAWCKAHRKGNLTDMELVSELISEYTDL